MDHSPLRRASPLSFLKITIIPTFFFLFLLLFLSYPTTIAAAGHNRRTLHQPFFPQDASPPSHPPSPSPPKIPFSSPTPNQSPFFPTDPSPPSPPSPSSFASFPANISSLILPRSPKPKSTPKKLIAVAVAVILAAGIAISVVLFLQLRKRKRRESTDERKNNKRSVTGSRRGNADGDRAPIGVPKLQRPSQTSSEFLYLGTMVNSHAALDGNRQPDSNGSDGSNSNSRKLNSPELHPLPPLSRPNYVNAGEGSAKDEEEEEFYSPRGSVGGRESSLATGSGSRRTFVATAVANFGEGGSSSSSVCSSSSLGSPERSVSLSISPPVSMSPRNSGPKSPESIKTATIPSLPSPLLPRSTSTLVNMKETPSPSPRSSSSPERISRKSHDSSPRLSNVSDKNSPSDSSDSMDHRYSSSDHTNSQSSSPARVSGKSQESSPRHSNVSDENPQSPTRSSINIKEDHPRSPSTSVVPPSPGIATPPPPPPLPPARRSESPRTPPPPTRQQVPVPPVTVAPLKPLAVQSPALVSPIELPPIPDTAEESQYETPKPKLKPLHWDKVRAISDREMVWDQLRSSSFKLNEEMIETLFVVNTSGSNAKEQNWRPVLPSPAQENQVLDPKKSQNIAIQLRALNVTTEEVCEALSEGNVDTLGTELLESLLKMAPTKEEERKLKEYKEDSPLRLGPAERFLKAMLDIPFAFNRINAMLYVSNFDSEIEYLNKSFETLEAACEELRNSRMFLKLLEAVLKTGNRMNVGTNRGDAHAFKLDTLLKLVDVKGADGRTTLLHFVVQEIIKSEGARLANASQNFNSTFTDDTKCRRLGLQVVSGLSSELANVKKAATMDSEVLNGDVLKLSKGIANIAEVVRLNEAMGSNESNRRFTESMNKFMKVAEEEIIKIQAQESVALSLVKEITEYFHGNSAKEEAHPFRIFMVVRDFLVILDKVCKEVGLINERTIVSTAHKFPVPVNPTLPPGLNNGFPGRQPSSSSSDDECSSP